MNQRGAGPAAIGADGGEEDEAVHHVVGVGVEQGCLAVQAGVAGRGAEDQQRSKATMHRGEGLWDGLAMRVGLGARGRGHREHNNREG